MPKKSGGGGGGEGGGGRAWTYSRMSLTSLGADERNRINRECEQNQQVIPLSQLQTSETRPPPATNYDNSCPHYTSADLPQTPPVGNFRPATSQAQSPDNFRSISQQSRPNNFRSSPSRPQQQMAYEHRESPQAVNNSASRNVQHRSNHRSSTSTATPPPLDLDLAHRNASSPDVCCRRDLSHQARVSLRPNNFLSPEAPRDEGGKIYGAFVLAGVGYMLPFTCFVVAVDFYQVGKKEGRGEVFIKKEVCFGKDTEGWRDRICGWGERGAIYLIKG